MPDSLELQSRCWSYVVGLYGKPDVAAACLDLQSRHGVDVSFLLVLVWLGHEKQVVSANAISELIDAVEGWRANVVQRLRAVRQDIKAMEQLREPVVSEFREAIKGLEVRAEQIEIALLVRHAAMLTKASAEDSLQTISANVACYLERYGADAAAAGRRIIGLL